MRVAIEKATGRVLEMQEHATAGTLIRNMLSCGLKEEDVEEREVTRAQYQALLAAQPKSRHELVAEIERAREAALEAGVTWNGHAYHVDATFQAQITGLVAAFAAGILPAQATVEIRRVDNTIELLNYTQLKALAGAVLARVKEIWATSWAAKDAL